MTDFLYPTPSALSGAARTLDLFGQFDRYNLSESTDEADARALFSDWRAVGRDLFSAMKALDPTCGAAARGA